MNRVTVTKVVETQPLEDAAEGEVSTTAGSEALSTADVVVMELEFIPTTADPPLPNVKD